MATSSNWEKKIASYYAEWNVLGLCKEHTDQAVDKQLSLKEGKEIAKRVCQEQSKAYDSETFASDWDKMRKKMIILQRGLAAARKREATQSLTKPERKEKKQTEKEEDEKKLSSTPGRGQKRERSSKGVDNNDDDDDDDDKKSDKNLIDAFNMLPLVEYSWSRQYLSKEAKEKLQTRSYQATRTGFESFLIPTSTFTPRWRNTMKTANSFQLYHVPTSTIKDDRVKVQRIDLSSVVAELPPSNDTDTNIVSRPLDDKSSDAMTNRMVAAVYKEYILINPKKMSIRLFMKDYPALVIQLGLKSHVFRDREDYSIGGLVKDMNYAHRDYIIGMRSDPYLYHDINGNDLVIVTNVMYRRSNEDYSLDLFNILPTSSKKKRSKTTPALL